MADFLTYNYQIGDPTKVRKPLLNIYLQVFNDTSTNVQRVNGFGDLMPTGTSPPDTYAVLEGGFCAITVNNIKYINVTIRGYLFNPSPPVTPPPQPIMPPVIPPFVGPLIELSMLLESWRKEGFATYKYLETSGKIILTESTDVKPIKIIQ